MPLNLEREFESILRAARQREGLTLKRITHLADTKIDFKHNWHTILQSRYFQRMGDYILDKADAG